MYQKDGRIISLEQAQAAAKRKELSLDGWLEQNGFSLVNEGKTTVPKETTPPTGPGMPTPAGESRLGITLLESPAQSFPNSYLIETGEKKSKRQIRAEQSKAIYEQEEMAAFNPSALDPRLQRPEAQDATSIDMGIDDSYAGLGVPTIAEQNEFKIEEDDLDAEIVDETNLVFNKPAYDQESGTYKRTNSFVTEYFTPKQTEDINVTLKASGVKVDDFEGWLKRDELGQEFLERVERGDFNLSTVDETSFEDYAVAKTGLSAAESNQLIQQMELKDLLERYVTEINDRTNKKAFVKEYRENPEKYASFINWDDAYDSYIYYNGSNNTINDISKFTDNQFKELKAYEDKLTKKFVDTQLKNSEGEIVGRSAAQSAINFVREAGIAAYRGLAVDPYILINSTLGFDSKAAQLRDSKKLADMRLSHLSKGTYLQPPAGKSMTVDGVQYHLGNDGVLYNLDAEVVANTYLDDKKLESLYLKIGGEGEEVTFPEQSWKGGAIQFGGVVGALVPQIAGMRGVGSLRRAGSTKGINAINKARKAKGAKPINTRVRGQGGRFASTKETFGVKMPFNVEVLDNVVFSSYYGYQTGMEGTFTAAREAGLTEEESYKLANMAGRQMSLLYMGTAPIAPRIPAMKAFDKFLKAPDVLNKAIRGYSKSGNNANVFKNILSKEFAENFAKGSARTLKVFGEEGAKEIVQENIQQWGEFTIVNKNVNEEASKKILKQDYSLNDIINTSILSFAAGGLGGAVGSVNSPLASRNKLQNLYVVSQDLKGAAARLKLSVETGAMTQENADNILRDAANFAKHGNKVPEYYSRNANNVVEAVNLIEERSKLEAEKKQLDKSLQSGIDEEIKAIDDKIESLDKKVRTEALEAEIENVEKIAGKDKIKVYNTVAEMKDAKDADGNALFDNQALESDGLFINDEGTIIVNKEVAIETGAIGVASHELLHRILKSQFGNIGDNEVKVINEVRNSLKGTDLLERLDKRAKLVDENGKKIYDIDFDEDGNVSGQDIDEFITFLSDEMALGQLDVNETTLQKIGRLITDFFKNVFGYNKEFTSGQQVLEFLKDYRTGIKSGKLSAAARKKMEASDKIKTGKIKKSTTPKSLLGDINALVPESVQTQEQFFDRKVFNPIYNDGKLHPSIANYIRSRAVSKEEAQKIIESVGDRLINFNPEAKRKSGDARITLGEFIFSNVNFGKLDARKALFEEGQERAQTESTDSETAKQVVAREESTIAAEDKPTYKTLTKRRVLSEDAKSAAEAKVLSNVRVLKSRIDAKVGKNVTVTPLIAEIKKTLGKQLDIDFKKEMGGKKDGQLRKYLLRNKAAILENMTTTWLMTAMPNAVQKQVDGVWTSDWKGKKIDREAVSTDNAGRTSGAELVRRLPKAATRLSDADYLSNILDTSGAPIRGRKESLAKAMAEQYAIEIIRDGVADPESEIGKAFLDNQARKGVEVTGTTAVEFNRQAEQGNVKFSKSTREITGEFNPSLDLELEGRNKTNSWLTRNKLALPPDLRTEAGQDAYIAEMKSTLLPLMPKSFWFGDKGGSVFTGTVKGLGSGLSSSDPMWRRWQEEISKIANDAEQAYGKDISGISDFKLPSYTTLFKNPQTILQNIANGKITEFNKKAGAIHAAMWANFDKAIKADRANATVIARYLNLSSSNTQHPQRMGAQFVGFSEGFSTVKDVTFEHAMPNISSYIYLLDAALNSSNFNGAYNAVVSNYKLLALAKDADKKLVGRYKTNMPVGWNLVTDNWFDRYFNPEIAANKGGIDPNSIITLNGEKFGDRFGVRNDGTIKTEAGVKFNKEINAEEAAKAVEEIKQIEGAKFSKSPKKIRVFDFDDTLARTKSNVLYTMPDGTKGKISASLFAKDAGRLEALGAQWDFSEFNKVMKGTKGPLLKVAKIIAEKSGTNNIFVLTARPQEAAGPIKEFLASVGLNIPIENITGLGNGTPKAKADWMKLKAAEGYNDFYFADDHTGNVKAVKEALNTFDVKSKVQVAKFSKSVSPEALNKEFNNILERKTGVEAFKTFSAVQAQKRGEKKGRFKFFVAPSVDDFRGLVNYAFAGKGKQGEADMKWLEDNLMTPYAKGVAAINGIRQQIKRDFKTAVKAFPKQYQLLNKEIGKTGFTYDQAVRVYLWGKAGIKVPGLSQKDTKILQDAIRENPELMDFADAMLVVARRDTWMEPSEYWSGSTLLSDLNSMTEKIGRKKYLEEFIQNADAIFTTENLNKIEALYGKAHREAIEDSLYSMKNGTNRNAGGNKQVNAWLNWINGSTGAIMFFNRRSALLQMLSFTNFINWSDNNPAKAAAAFANQKQYWSDWAMIFNSDKLKERRGGLKQDVSSNEIASIANASKNSPQAILAKLLQLGFTPTQIADSMAIATGGAMYYRNRVNALVKEGMSQKDAEAQAFIDFSKKSDEAQQSSDPALVSQLQRSTLGRLIFAFQNTPMQYTRLMKKAALDLANNRGDWKENVSKIAYYGIIQNFIFSALQSALFAMLPGFDDDDEDLTAAELDKKNAKEEQKITRVLNSMLDTVLKGSGVYGAVFSTVKNIIREYNKQEKKGFMSDHAYTVLSLFDISPPIGSKARKVYSAIQTRKFEKDEIAARGWGVTADGRLDLGPNWTILGKVLSASINLPLDRVVDELTSVSEAFDARNKAWQRIALGLGWKTWDVGAIEENAEAIKEAAKKERKEAGTKQAKETRARKSREKQEAYDKLTPLEKAKLKRAKAEEKRRKKMNK